MKRIEGVLAVILQTIVVVTTVCAGISARQARFEGQLGGQVIDELGAVVVGATVVLVDSSGNEKKTMSDERGGYRFEQLRPGAYALRVDASGFATFVRGDVMISSSRRELLDVKLTATIAEQKVSVAAGTAQLGIDPAASANAIVIKGRDLDALPDDPDELASALQALAGPAAGPSGGQLFIDGFLAGRAPQKSAIRQIQINQNPFAAENDGLGMSRIEISTKAGSPVFHGGASATFNDEAVNSRNPFAVERPPFQIRAFGGNLTGPVIPSQASFFFSLFRREIDDNANINATVVSPEFNVVPFRQTEAAPRRMLDVNPRFDFQLNKSHNLTVRYNYSRAQDKNQGIGDLTLPLRAYNATSSSQVFQITETAIINPRTVNEIRFQFSRAARRYDEDASAPSVTVLDAFLGGDSQLENSINSSERSELQDNVTRDDGRHSIKFGARLRRIAVTDISYINFSGAWVFSGGLAPLLNSANQVVRDESGRPVLINASSIERYRRSLLFAGEGRTPVEIRALGGGPELFTIAAGDPRAGVRQLEFGGFAQDDWRLRPDFLLSIGLRYEAQSNITNNLNFAPRVAFAWSPGSAPGRPVKAVIRGGVGVFFQRIPEGLTLQSIRFDGQRQQQFVVSDPGVLESFPATPPADQLASFAVAPTIWQVAPDARPPYTIQSSLSVERQLPHNFTVTAAYINGITAHALRSRNINAPLPGSGGRPDEAAGNIFSYESSGVSRQHLFAFNAYNRSNKRFTLFASYVLAKVNSDTDGPSTFPADPFDLSGEYGRSALDIRQRVIAGAAVNLPWQLTLNPFVLAASGGPFNITTGKDSNGDTVFSERPAFATDLSRPSVKITRFGAFDLNPQTGGSIVPRNFGSGPGSLVVNLRIGKTFVLNHTGKRSSAAPAGQRATSEPRPYKIMIGLMATNILNHTNRAAPIGNLSSLLFGRSIGLASSGFSSNSSNRRIDLQVNFAF